MMADTSRAKDRLFNRGPAGWYLIGFARSRMLPSPGNPTRVPVGVNADWY
jgi:hypothetical protein